MKRRRIQIGGVPLTSIHLRHAEIKRQISEKFQDSTYVDKFLDTLLRSGWDSLDIDSAVRQSENSIRPSVEAFLFHNEHVIDQLRLTQGVYTLFRDTAQDPNYSIRHPAQVELLFRRMTPGDLILLSAAHYVSANLGDSDRPSDQVPRYWQRIWTQILRRMPEIADGIAANRLLYEPLAAVAAVLDFLMLTYEPDSGEQITLPEIHRTFMESRSPFYVGMSASAARVRTGSEFSNMWVFSGIEEEYESCWMAASILFCYAVDNEARRFAEGGTLGGKEFFHDKFAKLFIYNRLSTFSMIQEASHADQEAQDSPRPVPTSRLLP